MEDTQVRGTDKRNSVADDIDNEISMKTGTCGSLEQHREEIKQKLQII